MMDDREALALLLDDAWSHAVRALEAIGIDRATRRNVFNGKGTASLAVSFRGRDESAHACNRTMRINVRQNGPETQVATSVTKAIGHHVRMHERAAGRAPVEISEEMPLDHLFVNAPLAARLRLDHGDGAQQVVRQAIAAIDRNSRLARNETPETVPHCMVLNANVLDHREEIAEGVRWGGRTLIVKRTTLPTSMIVAFTGAPLSSVCDHPVLADEGNRIRSVSSVETVREHSKGTTVFETECALIAADRI